MSTLSSRQPTRMTPRSPQLLPYKFTHAIPAKADTSRLSMHRPSNIGICSNVPSCILSADSHIFSGLGSRFCSGVCTVASQLRLVILVFVSRRVTITFGLVHLACRGIFTFLGQCPFHGSDACSYTSPLPMLETPAPCHYPLDLVSHASPCATPFDLSFSFQSFGADCVFEPTLGTTVTIPMDYTRCGFTCAFACACIQQPMSLCKLHVHRCPLSHPRYCLCCFLLLRSPWLQILRG